MWVLCSLRSLSIPELPGTCLYLSVSSVTPFVSYFPHGTKHFLVSTEQMFLSNWFHSQLSRGLWGKHLQTFWWHLCCTDCRFQCRDLFVYACQRGYGNEHHLYCIRMDSSLDITNVCRHFSVSRYAPCWVLNMKPAARVACKSIRFTILFLLHFRSWQVGLAPAPTDVRLWT